MKKLLVTGASGFLGWNICNSLKDKWEIFGTVFSKRLKISGVKILQVDLRDFSKLKEVFHRIEPHAVIHTAAASQPNYCQLHREETYEINVRSSVNMAGLSSEYNIPFLFTSSDLVFDGLNAPYKEEDPPSPVSIYGEQKAEAEEGIFKVYPGAVICRMPLMFGISSPFSSSFIKFMVDGMKKGEEVTLFTDEYRTPISSRAAVDGLTCALKKGNGEILHFGGMERITRYDFGLILRDVLGFSNAKLKGIKQKDIVMDAPRSPDVSLVNKKALALGFMPFLIKEELEFIKDFIVL